MTKFSAAKRRACTSPLDEHARAKQYQHPETSNTPSQRPALVEEHRYFSPVFWMARLRSTTLHSERIRILYAPTCSKLLEVGLEGMPFSLASPTPCGIASRLEAIASGLEAIALNLSKYIKK